MEIVGLNDQNGENGGGKDYLRDGERAEHDGGGEEGGYPLIYILDLSTTPRGGVAQPHSPHGHWRKANDLVVRERPGRTVPKGKTKKK